MAQEKTVDERTKTYFTSQIASAAEELYRATARLETSAYNFRQELLRNVAGLTPGVKLAADVDTAEEKLQTLVRTARFSGLDQETVAEAYDQGIAEGKGRL